MSTASSVINSLKSIATPAKAKASAWFFSARGGSAFGGKTAEGQYGYGDMFLGVTVPEQRNVAKQYRDLPLPEVSKLLKSKVHECRLTALLILVGQYERGSAEAQNRIAQFYLRHRKYVNNWDLVDSSAPHILGNHLLHHLNLYHFPYDRRKSDISFFCNYRRYHGLNRGKSILAEFARSKNLWERRIAIVATQAFIRENQFTDTLRVAELLLKDQHDLIHKAVGWMLREVGNRSRKTEELFLKKHAGVMPRTMLRYAIEKFPERQRRAYLEMAP